LAALAIGALVAAGTIGLLFFVSQAHFHARGLGFLLVPLFALGGSLFGTRAVLLDKEGVTLFEIVRKKIIPWKEMTDPVWSMQRDPNSSSKSFVAKICDRKGAVYPLRGWVGHQVEIYLAVRKIMEER
jgi:hypothetical protein